MAAKVPLLVFLCLFMFVSTKTLVQVVMLSRHHLRAPLTDNLADLSPYSWPEWTYKPADLTAKGALLEEYMGEYINDWLKKEELLSESCPVENEVHIYGNNKHRTRESAKAFARGAFRKCNVTVHVLNSDHMDPVFNLAIQNASLDFKSVIIKEMQKKLDELQLRDIYVELEDVVDLSASHLCKLKSVCSFANAKDVIFYEIGEQPDIIGPLAHVNTIVDSFIMSYYEGIPLNEIAWGKIKTADQLISLAKVLKASQYVRFNSTILGRQVARPLLEYITSLFFKETPPKFSILHGHDSNLNLVMAAIGVKGFVLPDQYENTPLGGKLVLQKWHDEDNKQDLLKVDFMYQNINQLREGTKLSKENPPLWMPLELKECPVDQNGFCLWENFAKLLSLYH